MQDLRRKKRQIARSIRLKALNPWEKMTSADGIRAAKNEGLNF